jgi:hypothetical protein
VEEEPVDEVLGVVVELLLGVVLELMPPVALPLVEPLNVPELVVLELLGVVELLLVDGEVDEVPLVEPMPLVDEEEPGDVLDDVSVDFLLLLVEG